MRFRSLFWKQFLLYIGTLAISFALLAFAVSRAFDGYFVSRRVELLQQQAEKIVEILLQPYTSMGGLFSALTFQQRISDQISNIQSYMDANVLFIDAEYKVFMATSDMSGYIGYTLPAERLSPVMNGEAVTIHGQFTDFFPSKMLTVAYPIMINGSAAGAVLLNASIPELERTISDVVRITVVSIAVTGAAAFVFIYFSSRTVVGPLLAMNEAAKVIAGGDFEKRLEVKTRDEVGQLGESFNNMAESLAQQERLRREFLANVSHDLRTPLTSMRGFLEAMLDGTAPPEKTRRYLGIVLGEAERLSEMANDILDINRLNGAEVSLAPTDFDINGLVSKTARSFEPRVAEGGLEVKTSLGAQGLARADYEKIQRVVYNLLDNAVKFTPPGGKVFVSTRDGGRMIFVKVSDTGRGISPDRQKRVFDRFYKADEARTEAGSGLGLAIVRAFVKAHGGDITLKSEPGKGSEFEFSLPAAVI